MKNIVLLGGSNSVMKKGLQSGLNQENIKLSNLALGGSDALQNLYELKRERNKELIKNADLIISESNINDSIALNSKIQLSIEIIYRNLYLFYNELSTLNTKILIILLPNGSYRNYKIINKIHLMFIAKFNFNFIDMQKYYEENYLEFFMRAGDIAHQHFCIMEDLGLNIAKNVNCFLTHQVSSSNNIDFKICIPNEFIGESVEYNDLKNSQFYERVYILKTGQKFYFNSKFKDYFLIGFHAWFMDRNNLGDFENIRISKLQISNKNNTLFVELVNSYAVFNNIEEMDFVIDESSFLEVKPLKSIFGENKEFHLIALFLVKTNKELLHWDENLIQKDFNLAQSHNFSHLIPTIEKYKFVLEYYFNRFVFNNSHFKNRYFIYELGKYLAEEKKGIFAKMNMIIKIPELHIRELREIIISWFLVKRLKKLHLYDLLEKTEDEKENLKIKQNYFYRLGELFVRANKKFYKGGWIWFFFELKKLKKEFSEKLKK